MTAQEEGVATRLARIAAQLQTRPESSARHAERAVAFAVRVVQPCAFASLSLADSRGLIRNGAASDERGLRSDELQREVAQGPCLETVYAEPLIAVADLLEETRWPQWTPRAVEELGIRSLVCLRLYMHEERMGALNLFAVQPGEFTEDDVQDAAAVAGHVAAAVAAEEIGQLKVALDHRTVIGQATGLVMAEHGLDEHRAFDVLSRLSQESNRKLHVIAQDLVRRHGLAH